MLRNQARSGDIHTTESRENPPLFSELIFEQSAAQRVYIVCANAAAARALYLRERNRSFGKTISEPWVPWVLFSSRVSVCAFLPPFFPSLVVFLGREKRNFDSYLHEVGERCVFDFEKLLGVFVFGGNYSD